MNRRLKLACGGALSLAITLWGGWTVADEFQLERWWADAFAIRSVKIEGSLEYLDREHVKARLLPAVNLNYFAADVEAIKAVMENMPWVDQAWVAKQWPDTVVVRVREHRPYARWNDTGLLDVRGQRYEPEDVEAFSGLPQVRGPIGQELYLFKMLQEMEALTTAQGLKLAVLELNQRQAWSVRLMGDMEIKIGRQHDPLTMFKRFLRALPLLGDERIGMIAKVDLRYPNGFSVSWREADGVVWDPWQVRQQVSLGRIE